MAGIKIVDLKKSFQVEKKSLPVLTGVNLSLPGQQITVILGRSGCGKTTLLRLAGGLETPDSGQILYDDTEAADPGHASCGPSRRMALVWSETSGSVSAGKKTKTAGNTSERSSWPQDWKALKKHTPPSFPAA